MAAESARGRKLSELMADHILNHIYGDVLPAVVNGYRMADEFGEYR